MDSIIIHSFIFNLVIYNLEFLVIISFYLVWSNKITDIDRKRLGKTFALFYIICNSISLLALLFITKLYISELLLWSVQIFVMSLFILAPFLWIKYFFIKYAQAMSKLINSGAGIQSIYNNHNISAREQEIIQLILDGKGNNEIKETLFISYHTVKNHISNIYRKLDVSSRHELVHYFMKSRKI